MISFNRVRILIILAGFLVFSTINCPSSQAGNDSCGAVASAVDQVLAIPAHITAGLAGTRCGSQYEQKHSGQPCGPLGGIVDWAVNLPASVFSAITGHGDPAASSHYTRFPQGCNAYGCPGTVAEAGPEFIIEQEPVYVTYGIVRSAPGPAVPAVVTLNRPIKFDN